MDRAADNHYPTSPTEVITARPVQNIAACAIRPSPPFGDADSDLAILQKVALSLGGNAMHETGATGSGRIARKLVGEEL